MKKVTVLSVITTCLFGTLANSQVVVKANRNCARWSEHRSSGYYDQGEAQGHLIGLLNGFAVASGKDFWSTGGGLQPEQAYYWMDRYCQNNPLGDIGTGAIVLMNERVGKGWIKW